MSKWEKEKAEMKELSNKWNQKQVELDSWAEKWGLSRWEVGMVELLKEGPCHITTPSGYQGIRRDGCIKANSGELDVEFSVSKNNYGFKNKCVCIFDLRKLSDKSIGKVSKTMLGVLHSPSFVCLRLKPRTLKDRIPNKEAGLHCISRVESWIPRNISINDIQEVRLVMSAGATVGGNGVMGAIVGFDRFESHELSKCGDELFMKMIDVQSRLHSLVEEVNSFYCLMGG